MKHNIYMQHNNYTQLQQQQKVNEHKLGRFQR